MSDNENPNNVSIKFAEDFASRFMNQYANMLQVWSKNGYYNPIYANNAMKQFNTYSNRPTEEKLISWLNNPRYNEKELRGCSEFLFWSIMQFNRSVIHFASIANFDYELIPINPPNINVGNKIIALYKKQKEKNNEWLRKFRVKEQCENIMMDVVRSGGKFYYLRENENGYYLQTMPDDYCYISGRNELTGYNYSLNMSFFYQFPESVNGFAPEFYNWYQEFLNRKKVLNEKANPYRFMPIEKAVVFKWDDTRPEIIPPLSGSFKDSISIQDYKDLLKLNAELQTYQIMYLQAPLDESKKPTMTAQEITNYVAVAQSLVPQGTGVISTPMELNSIKFNNAQNMNNIVGTGENNFWSSIGVAGGIFGMDTKSAIALKMSVQSDYNYIKHMYNQFERFINYQLSKIDGKFNFKIRFLRRNEFLLEEDKKSSLSFVQNGGSPSRLFSSYGYEPYEHESIMLDSHYSNLYNLMRPLKTSYTLSKDDNKGKPQMQDSEIGQSGLDTRDGGYNEGKFSLKYCVNCGTEIDNSNNIDNIFCSEECQEEYCQNVLNE